MKKISVKKILSLFLIVTFVFSVFGIVKATAETKAFTLTDAAVKERSDTVESNVSVKNGNVNDDLVFHKVGDSITYRLTFKNNDTKDYVIKGIKDDNTSEYVTYTYDQHKDEAIKSGETKDILVKITYSKEVTDADKRNLTKAVKLSFEIEDTEGNPVTANVTVKNPKTNDGIYTYIILGAVSLIGISVLLLKNKKSGKLLIMLALIAPIAVKAAEASFIISFGGEIKLYDKVLVTTEVEGEKVSKLIPYEEKFTKPADPQKDGANFLGWFIGDKEYNFDKKVADDVVIVAKFKMIDYTVTFDPGYNGKVAIESVKFHKGDTVNAAVPFHDKDYTFLGWYDQEDSEGATLVIPKNGSFQPTGDITVYAHWEYGAEPNLVDVDENEEISGGDIVNFGPEKFVILYYDDYEHYYVALAVNPLGDNSGIKQVTENPISSKFSDSAYWVTMDATSTPAGWSKDGYKFMNSPSCGSSECTNPYEGDYASINNYGDGTYIPSDTSTSNLLYDTLDEYTDYLEDMQSFYYGLRYASLPIYNDLYHLGCRVGVANSCPSYMGSNYSYWMGSSIFEAKEGAMTSGKVGYIDTDSSIKLANFTDTKYIRPVIYISPEDIITPWSV